MNATPRLSVSLTDDDEKLLILLHSTLQINQGKRLSLAEVIRSAIRCKADELNISL